MGAKKGFSAAEPLTESWMLPSSPFNPDNKDKLGALNPRDVYWMPDGFGIVVYASTVNEVGQALDHGWEPIRLECEHWAPRALETLDCRYACVESATLEAYTETEAAS